MDDKRQRDNEVAARETQYNGNPQIALSESFRREASVALELIIKAVIAQRIECKISKPNVPSIRLTHDLVELWEDASLPRLPRADKHRLLIAKIILYWAGRYPAPKEGPGLLPRAGGHRTVARDETSGQNANDQAKIIRLERY
jgi:hypothetical protein